MTFDIWSEGYRATGEWAEATFHGTFEGETLDEAVRNFRDSNPEDAQYLDKMPDGRWAYWGCYIFDNEGDAREAFG